MTFLVNLMFRRLDKFDGPIFRGSYIRRGEAYIQDINWVSHLWGTFFWGGGGGGINVLIL